MPVVITHQKDESKDELGDSPLLNPLLQPLGVKTETENRPAQMEETATPTPVDPTGTDLCMYRRKNR